MGFQLRILLSMLLVIVLSLAGTMLVTWQFANEQEEEYNEQRLIRKEASVQRSLQYTLERLPQDFETEDIPMAFSDRICELADIHGMDIALYDSQGRLLTQSTQHGEVDSKLLLDEELLGSLLLSDERLKAADFGPFVQVYWNFMGKGDSPVGIASVRYEKRPIESGDFKSFWSQLAPLYVVLLASAVLLALVLSNGLVRNLRMIRDRIRDLEPGQKQSPLKYEANDAIGELVAEYNKLLSELNLAVEKLAKQEREGAWRMMAMQVAHEIKNPLTPIKLGTQQLERAWKDEKPDFGDRLHRHCQVVRQQIDALVEIAQDFSMLAEAGQSNSNDKINFVETIEEAMDFYKSAYPDVIWQFTTSVASVEIQGSRLHILRVFNNLFQNAADAVGEIPDAQVHVNVEVQNGQIIAKISDNGVGIPDADKPRIFEPHFTAKKGGTGLGLAICMAIVRQMDGTIMVSSGQLGGAEFTISFLDSSHSY